MPLCTKPRFLGMPLYFLWSLFFENLDSLLISESKFSKNNDHKKWVRFVYNGIPQDRNLKYSNIFNKGSHHKKPKKKSINNNPLHALLDFSLGKCRFPTFPNKLPPPPCREIIWEILAILKDLRKICEIIPPTPTH